MIEDALTGMRGMLKVAGLPAPEIGPAPDGDSIGMFIAGGIPAEFLSRGRRDNLTLVVNVKNSDQKTAISWGETVQRTFTKRGAALPTGTGWRVESIALATPLTYVDREESGRWIYSVVFDLFFTTKGV